MIRKNEKAAAATQAVGSGVFVFTLYRAEVFWVKSRNLGLERGEKSLRCVGEKASSQSRTRSEILTVNGIQVRRLIGYEEIQEDCQWPNL